MNRIPGFSAQSTLYSSTGRYRSRAGGGVFSGHVEPSFSLSPRYLSSYTPKDFMDLSHLRSYLCCLNMKQNGECSAPAKCVSFPYGLCACIPPVGGGKPGEE